MKRWRAKKRVCGAAIIERIGWEEREEGPAFTATLVFPNGPPDLAANVVWKAIPVRLVVEPAPLSTAAGTPDSEYRAMLAAAPPYPPDRS